MIGVAQALKRRKILDWLAEVTGVGIFLHEGPLRRSPTHDAGMSWRCNAEAAESFLKQVLPYLKLKNAQAEMATQFQERLRDPKLKADRTWQKEWYERMKALNRRGPELNTHASPP
jgi:hypothetical protein